MTAPLPETSAPRTKADIARENGAKSNGPTSPEGRARSCLNSMKHSLAGKTIILSTEDQQAFQLHNESYVDSLNPITPVECDLVHEMVVSKWQERRCDVIEAAVMNLQMDLHRKQSEEKSVTPDEPTHLALVFLELADHSKVLQLLLRYRTEHGRRYHRALKQLIALREKGVFSPSTSKVEERNEPTAAANPNKQNEPPSPTNDPEPVTGGQPPTSNPTPAAQPKFSRVAQAS